MTKPMRLIGSMIEDEFRRELVASRTALMQGADDSQLRSILQEREINLSRAVIVYWVPEQGEDFYEVLHGSEEVLRIELPHDGSSPAIETTPLADYLRQRHTRPQRIKLAVALDLLDKGNLP